MIDLGQFLPNWVAVLADATLKGLVILAVAAIITAAMRNASAAARHAVWAMALGSVLIVPMLATVLPGWDFGIIPSQPTVRPMPLSSGETIAVPVPLPDPSPVFAPNPIPRVRVPDDAIVATPVPPRPAIPVENVSSPVLQAAVVPAGIIWAIGAMLVLGLLVIGLVRTSVLARKSTPVVEDDWLLLNERLCGRLGIGRPITLLRNRSAKTPATWGVFRPIILLPVASEQWSTARRRDVLVHELAHVKRFDFLTQLIGRYACAVFWFNPLMWLAARQMRIERERACDDEVLLAGAKASTYAGHLLEIARSITTFSPTSFSSVAMAQRSQLSGRLLAILDDSVRRGSMSRFGATVAWLVAFLLLWPVASLEIVRAQTADRHVVPQVAVAGVLPESQVPATVAMVPVKPRVVSTPMVVTPVQQNQSQQWAAAPACREVDGEDEPRGINENANDDRQTSRWWDGDCEGEVRLRDEVRFNNDYTDIRSIHNGGLFSIEIDVNGDSRRVEIRPTGNTLQRRWFINGGEVTYDAEARRWWPLALQDFFRHSSYDLDNRVRWLLASGGVNALLAQADRSHGQYLKRRFYVAAIQTGDLEPAQINQIIQRATRDVTSDFELANLLRAIPAQDLRNTELRQTYIQAANTIESDFEKARVLTELLQQDGLETNVIRMLLSSARDIESDFELARLLIALGARYLDDPAARQSYLEAANSIESDFELQRVLASLLERENLSTENLQLLLRSAAQIESDFESARLLIGVADKFVVEESLRRFFFQSVEGIESDFERQRVLTTLIERDGLSHEVVADAIQSATTIESDFAKATVLTAIASKYRGNDALRSQLETAAETISSDHEYGRVMGAIRGRRGLR